MRPHSSLRIIASQYRVSLAILLTCKAARDAFRAADLAYAARMTHSALIHSGGQFHGDRAVQLRGRVKQLEGAILARVETVRNIAAAAKEF